MGREGACACYNKVGCAPLNLVRPSFSRSVMTGLAAGLNLCSFEYLFQESSLQNSLVLGGTKKKSGAYLLACTILVDSRTFCLREMANQNMAAMKMRSAARFHADGGGGWNRGSLYVAACSSSVVTLALVASSSL